MEAFRLRRGGGSTWARVARASVLFSAPFSLSFFLVWFGSVLFVLLFAFLASTFAQTGHVFGQPLGRCLPPPRCFPHRRNLACATIRYSKIPESTRTCSEVLKSTRRYLRVLGGPRRHRRYPKVLECMRGPTRYPTALEVLEVPAVLDSIILEIAGLRKKLERGRRYSKNSQLLYVCTLG